MARGMVREATSACYGSTQCLLCCGLRGINAQSCVHWPWVLRRLYEDRFGTEADPVIVPSVEEERIIGVTDPDDDNLVVWGILRDGEGPRQFIEGGEFYVLKKVPYVKKVGDVLDEIAASKSGTPLPK